EFSSVDPAIRSSNHADYQINVAMSLKARLGKPPRAIAEAIVQHLSAPDVIQKAEIAGPGFINLTLRDEFLAESLKQVAKDERLGVPLAEPAETVVID